MCKQIGVIDQRYYSIGDRDTYNIINSTNELKIISLEYLLSLEYHIPKRYVPHTYVRP